MPASAVAQGLHLRSQEKQPYLTYYATVRLLDIYIYIYIFLLTSCCADHQVA